MKRLWQFLAEIQAVALMNQAWDSRRFWSIRLWTLDSGLRTRERVCRPWPAQASRGPGTGSGRRTLGIAPRGEYRVAMQKISIDALARQQVAAALAAGSGRAADTVFGGHEKVLRQTVMAFKAGTQLSEHQNPGEATVFVLRGCVRLRAGNESWQGKTGDLLIVPDGLHSLEAEEDSAILMTVAKIRT